MSVEETKVEFISAFQVLVDEFKESKAKIVERVKASLGSEVAKVLADSKKIENIYWTQYTPYFNDGEECHFSTSISDLQFNVDMEENYRDSNSDFLDKRVWSDAQRTYVDNPDRDMHELSIVDKLEKLLEPLNNDELLEDIFGDHVSITITKEGVVIVEEYDHE